MEQKQRIAMRVSICSIWVNIGLSLFKFAAGIVAHSGAMISDAVHSASDVASTVVVMIGVKLAQRKADKRHPYGHERLESAAALLLAVLLVMTGIGIGWNGLLKITGFHAQPYQQPGILALAAAVISIGVKEWMFWYTRGAAKKTKLSVLMADAWHHRSDAISSVGSLIGIAGARMGYGWMDPLASVLICILIVKVGVQVAQESLGKLVDQSCGDEMTVQMRQITLSQPGVETVEDLKTRMFGSKVYVDIIISADGQQPLYQAHETAQRVHDAVEQAFPEVKHCMVHVNPVGVPEDDTERL